MEQACKRIAAGAKAIARLLKDLAPWQIAQQNFTKGSRKPPSNANIYMRSTCSLQSCDCCMAQVTYFEHFERYKDHMAF